MDYVDKLEKTQSYDIRRPSGSSSRLGTSKIRRKRSTRPRIKEKFQIFKKKRLSQNPKGLQIASKEISQPVNIKDYEHMIEEIHDFEAAEARETGQKDLNLQTNHDIFDIKDSNQQDKAKLSLEADETSSPEKEQNLHIKNPIYRYETLKSIAKDTEEEIVLENSKLSDALRSTKKSIDLSEHFQNGYTQSRDSKKDAGNQSNIEIESPSVNIKRRPTSGFQSRKHDSSTLTEQEQVQEITNITKMNPNNVVNWYKNKKEILRQK